MKKNKLYIVIARTNIGIDKYKIYATSSKDAKDIVLTYGNNILHAYASLN